MPLLSAELHLYDLYGFLAKTYIYHRLHIPPPGLLEESQANRGQKRIVALTGCQSQTPPSQ
jgi:hypothetical protein